MLVGEFLQRQIDHADGPFDNLLTGRDDGVGLLAAQHHAGNFGGVGQIVDAGLDNLDAGDAQAAAQLLFEAVVDFLAAAAEGELVAVVVHIVVGVEASHFAEGGVALHVDKAVVALERGGLGAVFLDGGGGVDLDVEAGLVGVLDFPHQHEADHDGVAVLVVHLDGGHVHVARPQREAALAVEGVHPEEAVVGHRAAVLAEEGEHARLVGLDDHEADAVEDVEAAGHDAENSPEVLAFPGKEDGDEHDGHHHDNVQKELEEAVVDDSHGAFEFFCFHVIVFIVLLRCEVSKQYQFDITLQKYKLFFIPREKKFVSLHPLNTIDRL